MKKYTIFILILSVVILFSGCTMMASLYPVEGPMANSGNIQKIPVKYTWTGSGHGKIELTMPDGEKCKGEYSTVASGQSFVTMDMSFQLKYFGTSVSSKQQGQAIVIGDKGTILQLEYYVSTSNHGYGAGKDNKGNLYKMLW